MVVRCNSADHTNLALVTTDMGRGGPHTPHNVQLLVVCAGGFLVLLTLPPTEPAHMASGEAIA